LGIKLKKQSLATVETLVSTRAVNIEHKDKSNRTPLALATGYGYLDVVRFLLSEGARVGVVDHEGYTPVDRAKKRLVMLMLLASSKPGKSERLDDMMTIYIHTS
jgi:ankyrin repeat protein